MERQNEATAFSNSEKPKKQFYTKWWFKILGTICILLIIIAIFLSVFMYLSTNPEESCSLCGESHFLSKIREPLYEHRCEKAGMAIDDIGWVGSIRCLPRSSEAGKDCLQNKDCKGGACKPSGILSTDFMQNEAKIWKEAPRVTGDGFVLGTCSEAQYTSADDEDFMFCGQTIDAPSPSDTPGKNITTVLCD